jgi:predicted lactoylglutathione lyase
VVRRKTLIDLTTDQLQVAKDFYKKHGKINHAYFQRKFKMSIKKAEEVILFLEKEIGKEIKNNEKTSF